MVRRWTIDAEAGKDFIKNQIYFRASLRLISSSELKTELASAKRCQKRNKGIQDIFPGRTGEMLTMNLATKQTLPECSNERFKFVEK